MSGLIRSSVTILSGTTNNNVIAGEVFEFLSRPAAVRVLLSQEEVLNSAVRVDLNLGNVIVTQNLIPNVAADPGVIDKDRDGFPAAVGAAGDRIQLSAREITGGVGDDGILNFEVEITDLA